ncbi:MAG: hypothetical protein A2359_03690 [Candidatus Moranbacteria bacterium RIFOXYB1_FULL_43_19]|nr:MAG: hypothetical protein A2184_02260 [Candidatus Moranbacteria bacterium RIFOXYA1_FULL_44_7]OGI26747.1 MAG: hypothetical protein A2359_03690 [Candidatus Moranbacteria bacterium RIFOXYB1_FULL_43_19]OGI32475.1 MAG: hypothetical protein A2420_03875 [Candidatus Moranbacteria bacterium RIFOXYC1_FULL_44_13]OGI37631.1 MAG: hypothetical protein A2612_04375 [Candidatus Moranbacteria bacterium RIFOXYD1_FULL_44_12]
MRSEKRDFSGSNFFVYFTPALNTDDKIACQPAEVRKICHYLVRGKPAKRSFIQNSIKKGEPNGLEKDICVAIAVRG